MWCCLLLSWGSPAAASLPYLPRSLPHPLQLRLLLLLPATQVAALKLLDRDDDIEKYAWYSLDTFDWLGKPLPQLQLQTGAAAL